ncbi:MAG: penicillin-binding protein 2 [Thermoanaerobaculia bacterium]|nr:penicillin-binding protein 2 [Thermoanaerobaculia bacterium]
MRKVREHYSEIVARVPRLQLGFVAALVLIAASYWVVQVAHGERYRELAEHNSLRKRVIKAPRGLIYDRTGAPLVENVPSYNLLLHPSRSRDLEASRSFVEGILGPTPESLEAQWTSPAGVVMVAEDLTLEEVAKLEARSLEYPEFEIEVSHVRLYRHGAHTAHLVGYLGEASEPRIESSEGSLRRGDQVGIVGLEAAYDEVLRGTRGERRVVVDHRGRVKREHGRTPARPGEELPLEIDLAIQQVVARYLEDRVGAVVALDPRDGAVRAMVSSPSYDPNVFARRLDPRSWQAIVKAPHDPLQNRTVQNTYSPGSVFKIVVATAALSESVTHPGESVYCGGAAYFYNHRYRCWKRQGHGNVNMREAIKESCDIYFYTMGQRLGIDRIADYSRRFGLGRPTGIEIAGEKAGLVPDDAWSREARGTPWYVGETISVAIGQGPLLVTPLQMAAMMAIVANGGWTVEPHLVRGEAERHRVELDPHQLERVREALWAVVNEQGTGASARLEEVEIAGKTATVQVVEQVTWIDSEDLPYERRDHAWFASFAPVDAPELVVVSFVEHGGRGSQAAAPLAKLVYETYFGTR